MTIAFTDSEYVRKDHSKKGESGYEVMAFDYGSTVFNDYFSGGGGFYVTIPYTSVIETYFLLRLYDNFAIDVRQNKDGSITIHQEMGGYEIFQSDRLTIIEAGWSCK